MIYEPSIKRKSPPVGGGIPLGRSNTITRENAIIADVSSMETGINNFDGDLDRVISMYELVKYEDSQRTVDIFQELSDRASGVIKPTLNQIVEAVARGNDVECSNNGFGGKTTKRKYNLRSSTMSLFRQSSDSKVYGSGFSDKVKSIPAEVLGSFTDKQPDVSVSTVCVNGEDGASKIHGITLNGSSIVEEVTSKPLNVRNVIRTKKAGGAKPVVDGRSNSGRKRRATKRKRSKSEPLADTLDHQVVKKRNQDLSQEVDLNNCTRRSSILHNGAPATKQKKTVTFKEGVDIRYFEKIPVRGRKRKINM